MARKPRNEEVGSLDSLLDTMTNVVGILVIVLIVTQINVAEALKRIESNLPKVTEEDVKQLEALLDENRKSRDKLETTWSEQEPKENEEEKLLEQLKLEIDEVAKDNEDVVKETSDLEELKKLIAEHKDKVAVSNEEVKKADEELQKLKAMLDETPDREVIPPKVVNLPNPRFAPDGAEPRLVVCSKNRIFVVGDLYEHLYKVGDFLDARIDQFAYRGPAAGSYAYTLQSATKKNSAGNPDVVRDRDDRVYRRIRLDAKKVEDYFKSNSVGGDDFAYRVKRSSPDNDYLKLVFELKPEGGESIDEIGKPGSRFAEAVRGVGRNYLYYHVAPDSFDAYLQARELSERAQVPAGWTVWSTEELSPKPNTQRATREMEFSSESIPKLEELSRGLAPLLKTNYEKAAAENATQIAALVGKLDEVIESGFPDLEAKKRADLKALLTPYLKGTAAIGTLEGKLRPILGSANKAEIKRVYDWVYKVVRWEADMYKYWAEVEELRKDSAGKVTAVLRDKRGNETQDRSEGTSYQLVHAAQGMRSRETVIVSPQAPNVPFVRVFKASSAKLPQLPPKKEGDEDVLDPGGNKERQKQRKDMLD